MNQISPASLLSLTTSLGQTVTYVANTLTPTAVSNQLSFVKSTKDSFINYLNIITAYYIQYWMSQEYTLITAFDPMSVGLNPTDISFINNRINAFNNLVNSVYTIPLWLPFNLQNLQLGSPTIQYYDLINYFCSFNFEVPPTSLTIDNFASQAQEAANAWNNVLTYWQTNSYGIGAYNSVERMYYASQDTATIINDVLVNAPLENVNLTTLWNAIVALPSLLKVADILINNPSNPLAQSVNAIKYYLLSFIIQLNPLLANANIANTPVAPVIASILAGESLMDFASRTTGSYANWISIAQINNLVPPYVGVNKLPGIATPGTYLYLQPPPNGNSITNYLTTYLGTDIYLGEINIPLESWDGEFTTVNGYNNLSYALARRVLTQVGSLIYHVLYGSKLPGQVGAIQVAAEINLLIAYLKSALLQDPRVATINQVKAVALDQNTAGLVAGITAQGNPIVMPFGLALVPKGGNPN